jgi:hypothetical protein
MLPALLLAAAAATAPAPLKPALAGMGFLVGDWSSGRGVVADTGGASSGVSTVTVEAGGGALLRRDHTELTDKAGKPSGGFDQIMLIYAEGDAVRAEYSDGAHVIHYATATVTPGRAVVFDTATGAPGPAFRLAYTLTAPRTLGVAFSIKPPGAPAYQPIATGALTKTP